MIYRCSECNGLVKHWVVWGLDVIINEIYHCTRCGLDKKLSPKDEEVTIIDMSSNEK